MKKMLLFLLLLSVFQHNQATTLIETLQTLIESDKWAVLPDVKNSRKIHEEALVECSTNAVSFRQDESNKATITQHINTLKQQRKNYCVRLATRSMVALSACCGLYALSKTNFLTNISAPVALKSIISHSCVNSIKYVAGGLSAIVGIGGILVSAQNVYDYGRCIHDSLEIQQLLN